MVAQAGASGGRRIMGRMPAMAPRGSRLGSAPALHAARVVPVKLGSGLVGGAGPRGTVIHRAGRTIGRRILVGVVSDGGMSMGDTIGGYDVFLQAGLDGPPSAEGTFFVAPVIAGRFGDRVGWDHGVINGQVFCRYLRVTIQTSGTAGISEADYFVAPTSLPSFDASNPSTWATVALLTAVGDAETSQTFTVVNVAWT